MAMVRSTVLSHPSKPAHVSPPCEPAPGLPWDMSHLLSRPFLLHKTHLWDIRNAGREWPLSTINH